MHSECTTSRLEACLGYTGLQERARPSKYRAISLTCIACKCLEHIIHSNIMDHMDNNTILSDFQHGFHKKRSCDTQLIRTVHCLAKCLHDSEKIYAVLLRQSATCPPGCQAQLLLHTRKYPPVDQMLPLSRFISASAPVTSGAPQGSALGPVFFLCYMNDLPFCVSSIPQLFANDCILYWSVNSSADAVILQQDLNCQQKWEADWLIQFNPDKCEVRRITNRRGRRIDGDRQ